MDCFKEMMKKKSKIINSYKNSILEVKFENFINSFKTETNKIEKFLNLKKNIQNSFNFEFSKSNVYKAKNHLSKKVGILFSFLYFQQ